MRFSAEPFFSLPFFIVFLLVFLFGACPLAAENAPDHENGVTGGIEEILEGFEDTEETEGGGTGIEKILEGFEDTEGPGPADGDETVGRPSLFSLTGDMSLGASYNYAQQAPPPGRADYRDLSRLRLKLDLDLKVKLPGSWEAFASGVGYYDFAYAINGREQFTEEVLDNYEKEAELQDAYLQGSLLPELDLKAGRQIVVWGKSDNIRLTDVLNPLDNREPGLVDIEDLRLPVAMTRLDYFFERWSLTGIAVHEIRFNKNPQFGSDFFPSPFRPPLEELPENSFDNTEYAAALSGILRGWDIAFYFARIFDDLPHAEPAATGPLPAPVLRHSRLTMLGAATNIAVGNWLYKSEAAYFDGLEFFALPGKKKNRFDILLGVEYSGFTDTVVSVEAVNRHMPDYDQRLQAAPDNARENEFQTALRVQRDFLNDTLHVTALALAFGVTGQGGSVQRLSFEYEVNDALAVSAGLVNYESGHKTGFEDIGNNDRLFAEMKYSFQY